MLFEQEQHHDIVAADWGVYSQYLRKLHLNFEKLL